MVQDLGRLKHTPTHAFTYSWLEFQAEKNLDIKIKKKLLV